MRTKTLICAAILAAGVATSMAQSNVYSLNIVGYANVTIVPGNGFYSNPFNHATNNSASNIFALSPLDDTYAQPAGTMNSFYLLTWNGAGFNQVFYESDFTVNNVGAGYAGWAADATPSAPANPPTLNPGKGFIINNLGNNTTNTFVGDVVPQPGTTNSYMVGPGNDLIGSTLPVAGNQTGLTGPLPGPLSPLDDTYAQPAGTFNSFYLLTWNGAGFNQVFYESDFTVNNVGVGYAGWAVDAVPSAPASPPSIPIGVGFYINNLGNATAWLQTVP